MNAKQFFGQMRDEEQAVVRLMVKYPPSGYAQFRVQTLHAKLLERGGAFEQLALSKGFEELYWAMVMEVSR